MTKAYGLALIGAICLLIVLAWWIPRKPIRFLLVAVASGLYVVAFFAFVGLLAFERLDVGPFAENCPVAGEDSTVVASHWSWLSPGEVCEYPAGDIGPTLWRIPAAVALVTIPFAVIATWPKRRIVSRKSSRAVAGA